MPSLYHQMVRIWARGGGVLLVAGAAGLLTWSLLSVLVPAPVTQPRPGPVLESVTPAQLAAMNVRLDPALQPVQVPDWVTGFGVRLPTGIKLAGDAETAVRRSSGGVRSVTERVLAYATHSIFSGQAIDRINSSDIDQVVVTDTIPLNAAAQASSRIRVVSIGGLMAETLRRINNEESVFYLFNEELVATGACLP